MEPILSTSNGTNSTGVPYTLAYGELVFASIIIIIIAIAGIVGNFFIILSVILSKRLRTSTNAFVVSLSCADLLTCLFLPWYVVSLLGKNGWALPEAEWLCGTTSFILFMCIGVSLYNLAALAVNRVIYITRPFKYENIYKPWKVAVMVAMTWLVPGGLLVALVLAGIGSFGYETVDYPSCSDLDDVPHADAFNIAQSIIAFPVPLITIVVCYTWIFFHIRRHFKQKRAREAELTQYASKHDFVDSQANNQNKENLTEIKKEEIEITKYLFVIVCAFLACFLLFFIGNAIPNSGHFNFYTSLGTLANSAINFFIYATWHPQFKVVLRCMLRCRCADIPQPSTVLQTLTTASASNLSVA